MRLNLLEATAVQLLSALLEPAGPEREAVLSAAEANDPQFAQWLQHVFGNECAHRGNGALLKALAEAELEQPTPAHRALQRLVDRLVELRSLQQHFAERLETEKLAAMRELAYGASHEINNPLANIASRAQTLLREENDPEKRRKLAIINTQAFRAFEMIADLMLFAKPPQPNKQSVELRWLVEQVVGELSTDAIEQGTTLSAECGDEPLRLMADRTQIELAVRSLVRNSLEAVGGGGQVTVRLRRVEVSGGSTSASSNATVEIVVIDSGPGIPDELLPRVFDPFFSGREAGRGLGLGLSKCWRIAELHGGTVLVDRPSQGAQLRLRLPLSA